MLVGLKLADFSSPSSSFSSAFAEFTGGSRLANQSDQIVGLESFGVLAVWESFAKVTVKVSVDHEC